MTEPGTRIVVLDDDPTGIQTVHGCYMLTDWGLDILATALTDHQRFFYVLTNTRACSRENARSITGQAVASVLAANEALGNRLLFISRSDSTLRNHFPAEIEVIVRSLETFDQQPVDAIFLAPAFIECGRVTVDDTHYLIEGERRIPVSETEFARDSVFGYRTAVLPQYVEEKTRGAVRAAEVRSIPLEWLRQTGESTVQGSQSTVPGPGCAKHSGNGGGPGAAKALDEFLRGLCQRTYVVVNAENYADLNCFARAVLRQVAAGKRFVFQSAASLVKALAGLPDQPLLGREIVHRTGPGLFVVGSHVQRTTRQMERLLEADWVEGIEAAVEMILQAAAGLRGSLLERIEDAWTLGKTPVVFTSRSELQFRSPEERLRAGERVSHFLASLVQSLPAIPSYLVGKGGITSHDILARGLGVRQARVLGQILPGVPVVMTPDDSAFPGMPYVIFPGNVGGEDALLQVFEILDRKPI